MVLDIGDVGRINEFFGGFAYEGKTTAPNGVAASKPITNGVVVNGSAEAKVQLR